MEIEGSRRFGFTAAADARSSDADRVGGHGTAFQSGVDGSIHKRCVVDAVGVLGRGAVRLEVLEGGEGGVERSGASGSVEGRREAHEKVKRGRRNRSKMDMIPRKQREQVEDAQSTPLSLASSTTIATHLLATFST